MSSTIRSANGTTRSSRCSASSTETPEVVHQPGERGQHLLGRGRVERRGRLVEHEQPRVHGQHRADRDPLLLPAGERAQVAGAQVGDAEQVEGLLDPAAHGVGGQAELLHAVGELLLDGVGDEAGGRVLPDVPDDVGALARRLVDDATPSSSTSP